MVNKFSQLFKSRKPLIGMIHMAGDTQKEKIKRALDELTIYEEEGIDGAIIEDYHGTPQDVKFALEEMSKIDFKIIKGVNILRNPCSAFNLADEYGAKFVQFDSVQTKHLDLTAYNILRKRYSEVIVLGGVGFKYVDPTGNPLEIDIAEGKSRCEAIVTTGDGTGIETPLDKLIEYKKHLGNFPLISGAGINLNNAREQLEIANGAIIGSFFKPEGDTFSPVYRMNVRNLKEII